MKNKKELVNYKNIINKKLILIISFCLILLIVLLIFVFGNNNNNAVVDNSVKKNEVIINNEVIDNGYELNKIYFYENNGQFSYTNKYDDILDKSSITSIYKCDSWCTVYASQRFAYTLEWVKETNLIMLLVEEDNKNYSLLYNIKTGDVLGKYGDNPVWLRKSNDDWYDGSYILVNSKETDKYGIIDRYGNKIKDFYLEVPVSYNFIDESGNFYFTPSGILSTVYSVEDNMIVSVKNGKYGIIKIKSDDILVDYKYDAIRLVNDKYFKVKENNKWYLYSFETKNKIIGDGYDNLFVVNDDILIVEIDDYLYFKDYFGNNLTEERIEDVSPRYSEFTCCAASPGIEISIDNSIITIYIYEESGYDKYNKYEYNIVNNTLMKK